MKHEKKRLRTGWSIVGILAAGVVAASSALPGAWESFPTKTNADAWQVYDFADGNDYLPDWDGSEAGGRYISLIHDGDEPLIFFADNLPGNGAFTGNYNTANVAAVSCWVYIEDLDEFEYLDCSVFANGPAGLRYYYSEAYFYDDFDDNGWWKVNFSLSRPWFYYENGDYVKVADNTAFLADIRELAFGFYPRQGTTADSLSALDDVRLEPHLEPAAMTHAVTNGEFRMGFGKRPAVSYTLEKMSSAAPFTWSSVAGHTGLTGAGPHLFTTPANQRREIFRISSEAVYTPVVTSP